MASTSQQTEPSDAKSKVSTMNEPFPHSGRISRRLFARHCLAGLILLAAVMRKPRYRRFHDSCAAALVAVVLTVVSAVPALAFSGAKHCFNDSIKEIASDPGVHVIRQNLSASEH